MTFASSASFAYSLPVHKYAENLNLFSFRSYSAIFLNFPHYNFLSATEILHSSYITQMVICISWLKDSKSFREDFEGSFSDLLDYYGITPTCKRKSKGRDE